VRRYLPVVLVGVALVILGAGLSLLLERGILPDVIISGTFQFDLTGLAIRAGVVACLLVWVAGIVLWGIERRVTQMRVEEQENWASARRRFLRRLDHEMKNPLTVIGLGITNLQDGPNLTPEQRDSLQRISYQTQRLQKLVADLRWLVDLEQRGIEHSAVDLADVLEEAIALARAAQEHRSRQVVLHVQRVPWPLAHASGDRDLLVLAFRNLLDNALKYTSADDGVEVRAADDGQVVVVEVADTGLGIPSDEVTHIFEELYRGRNARGVEGSGLGLALVQRIVTLHGGDITVRSREGQGTVLAVRLPLAPQKP
jgi:two-component system OmpR family sensor kinase